jgi:hypothetical protein
MYGDEPVEHAPIDRQMLHDDKFRFFLQTDEGVLEEISQTIETIEKVNPDIQIILSVSPVPMERTFQKKHVVIANLEGKISLVKAAKELSTQKDNIYYFPSYEMVSSLGHQAMEADWRHVKNEVVDAVAACFMTFSSLTL